MSGPSTGHLTICSKGSELFGYRLQMSGGIGRGAGWILLSTRKWGSSRAPPIQGVHQCDGQGRDRALRTWDGWKNCLQRSRRRRHLRGE